MAEKIEDSSEQFSTFVELPIDQKNDLLKENIESDPAALYERVLFLEKNWAEIQLIIISPTITPVFPVHIIQPEQDPDSGEKEHVYPIHDFGFKLATSKGTEMYTAGQSMCKLYYTIEKMMALLVERLQASGIDKETEVQVAVIGQENAMRKLFESVINLEYNVVLTNFDPREWGEWFIATVQRMVDKGLGYPSAAPRDYYKLSSQSRKTGPKGG